MPAPEADPKLLPARDGDAPLHELTLDQLAAFLYASFTGEELLRLLRELRVSARGGYRLEAMDDLARADLLADELRAVPESRGRVIALLREVYEFPALDAVALPKVVAEEISALAVESDAPVRMLWRLLADPSKEIRETARTGLEALADEVFAPPPEASDEKKPEPAPAPHDDSETRALRKTARLAGAQAERAQEKNAELKEQLRTARAEIARLERESASRARDKDRLAGELENTRAKLAAARARGGVEALEKAEKARAELAARVASLEEKLRNANESREAAEGQLATARRELEALQKRPLEPRASEAEEPEATPSTWLLPRFTREFYDSLEGWDPRIQRAAFKQAYLLAENHRHPSLRAIPLEGIPGYYRVRIATDVRLIYRRSENEREVEILSLIDREDLDRYVRQAKTR